MPANSEKDPKVAPVQPDSYTSTVPADEPPSLSRIMDSASPTPGSVQDSRIHAFSVSPASTFLEEVADQIAYRPVRASLCRELREHITDRAEDYVSQGMTPKDAEAAAVRSMGDPLALGAQLNKIHSLQKSPALAVLSLLLLLTGFGFAAWMQWSPEQSANGFLYYLPGTLLLLLTAWKGCPLVIRHHRILLTLAACLYIVQGLLAFLVRHGRYVFFGTHVTGYFSLLLFGPILILLAYRLRRHGPWTLAAAMILCTAAIAVFHHYVTGTFGLSASLVLAFSLAAALLAMIRRGILGLENASQNRPNGTYRNRKGILYGILLAGTLLTGAWFLSSPDKLLAADAFVHPEASVHSTWDDTYNNVLIRELLSRTPAVGGLNLDPEELMDYGTGAWYFSDRDPLQIGLDVAHLKTEADQQAFDEAYARRREAGAFPRLIHYDQSDVTLWDILPQHYHNNYLIAVTMFLYGRIPGLLLAAVLAGFYLVLFSCIHKIHGKLAFSLACCCGFCLLGQSILYVLGNLGYQYACFTNLPLVSEGKISILFNMMLLGFIFSAYRYDHVLEEPASRHFLVSRQTPAS